MISDCTDAQNETIPKHLTLDEVVDRLHFSRQTIIRLCEAGELDAWQQGRRWRIAEPSIVQYLRRRREANRKRAEKRRAA